MELDITQSQRNLFDEIVLLAREGVTVRDRDHTFSRARWDAIRSTGLTGLTASDRLGGRNITSVMELVLVMHALGYGSTDVPLTLALSCHLFGGVLPLSRWGTPEQQAAYLPRLISGEWYSARALPDAMEAKPVNGGFSLTGVANIDSAGLRPDLALVFAQVSGRQAASDRAFLVPLSDTSAMWTRARGSALALADSLRFDQVKVPANMMLGSDVDGDVLLGKLEPREQLVLQATRLGLLQRLLETALESARKYTRRLKLKGVPPHRYQMLGHKLADFKVRFDATELLLRRAAWKLERRDTTVDVALAALAIDNSLIPGAFEVVKLQRDYALDEDHAWSDMLSDVVEYGRHLVNPAQLRTTVNEALRAGIV